MAVGKNKNKIKVASSSAYTYTPIHTPPRSRRCIRVAAKVFQTYFRPTAVVHRRPTVTVNFNFLLSSLASESPRESEIYLFSSFSRCSRHYILSYLPGLLSSENTRNRRKKKKNKKIVEVYLHDTRV